VSVAVKKIPGVEKVAVSLNNALVSIELKPGNSVRLDQIRKAILDDAFTPKDATVTVVGRVVQNNGQPALKVTDTVQLYELAPASPKATNAFKELTHEQGKTVTVQGVIPAPAKDGKAEARLLVESFSNPS
jgi:copper chaperone CopZ